MTPAIELDSTQFENKGLLPTLAAWLVLVFVLLGPSSVLPAGLSPEESLEHMRVADGFEIKLFASEPQVRQPVAMYFDERGRMWVIQYLQYPTPSGLKPVQVDQYLRTKYDRIPEPPPRGPKGADKITICEDTNGDGRADRFINFVSDLNLATGLAIGHGGVFVAQPPYLLFYPDRNHDDVPDGDPEVLLTGFGMEDAHAFPNSLQWGPDGWLYGAQGSTVTANIRGIEFQQGIWRYHPLTKEFELFAEGGGNTWGVDFDEHGNIIAGTNFGDVIGLHQVQGGYYVKGFSKHGPLHNPYTFGYFEHMPYKGFKGGHVTCGGIVYHGGSFPEQFRGTYIAANLLANAVYWHGLERDGSSFKGHFGGELLSTDDTWFRPVDCATGPDGSVFVADWCDRRATHVDPLDTWDRSNGRIYKIEARGTKPVAKFDLSKSSSQELVDLLGHRNDWFAREARRILAERRDKLLIPNLKKTILDRTDALALQSLWALYVTGGFGVDFADQLLNHTNANVRAWTVRLLGDDWSTLTGMRSVPAYITLSSSAARDQILIDLARIDPSPAVRNQLACTAKRLPGEDALPIVSKLMRRDEDANDPQIPLLIWWALENKAVNHREAVLQLFSSPSLWQKAIPRRFIVERLARRYAAEDSDAGFAACARLLAQAPGSAETDLLMNGIEQALAGRRLEKIPSALQPWFSKVWLRNAPNLALIRLGLRLGGDQALEPTFKLVVDSNTSESNRVALIEILGQVGQPRCVPVLLTILEQHRTPKLQTAALAALQRFSEPEVARAILALYPTFNTEMRNRARNVLSSRPAWALELVKTVEAGRVDAKDFSFDQLRQMALHKNVELDQLIQRRWGKVQSDSGEEKRSYINELKLVINPSGAAGRPRQGNALEGKKIFQQVCGVCHTLFGEGNQIGPELTGADRKNLEFMLVHIVNPSAYIRPEYVSYEVVTRDDQAVSGLMVESTPKSVTILDRNNQRAVFARDQIKELTESKVSLMPEGLLEALKAEQIIDLFAYLQSDGSGTVRSGGK